jgi:hypothetical protein
MKASGVSGAVFAALRGRSLSKMEVTAQILAGNGR